MIYTAVILILIAQNGMFDPENILRFADYLYKVQDYTAALQEYRRYDVMSDSLPNGVREHLIDCCVQINDFSKAHKEADLLTDRNYSSYVKGYVLYKAQLYDSSRMYLEQVGLPYEAKARSLMGLGFAQQFDFQNADRFIAMPGTLPKHKSIAAGALLSLFPGGGHFYCNRVGDGLFSFAVVGLCSALVYYYDQKDEDLKFGISLSAAILFYAGNIYGGINAVRNYNYYIDDAYRQAIIDTTGLIDPFYQ